MRTDCKPYKVFTRSIHNKVYTSCILPPLLVGEIRSGEVLVVLSTEFDA